MFLFALTYVLAGSLFSLVVFLTSLLRAVKVVYGWQYLIIVFFWPLFAIALFFGLMMTLIDVIMDTLSGVFNIR